MRMLYVRRSSSNSVPFNTRSISSSFSVTGPIDLFRPPGIPSSRIATKKKLQKKLNKNQKNILLFYFRLPRKSHPLESQKKNNIYLEELPNIVAAVFTKQKKIFKLKKRHEKSFIISKTNKKASQTLNLGNLYTRTFKFYTKNFPTVDHLYTLENC